MGTRNKPPPWVPAIYVCYKFGIILETLWKVIRNYVLNRHIILHRRVNVMLTAWYWMRTYVLIGNHIKMMHRKSHNHKLGHNLLMAQSGKVSYEDVQTPWLENMVENDRIHWFVFHFTIVDRPATLSQSLLTKQKCRRMEICPKETSNLILLLYFQMRKRFTKVWFTAIRKTNYKYMSQW